jgi:enoyl-CoA hydratase
VADLVVDRRGEHAVVTLNRPERKNALSIALRDAISDTLDELSSDDSLKAVVLTGTGDTFCSGFDLAEFDRAGADAAYWRTLWDSSDRYHRTLAQFPLPTIAAVNGPAIAGGFDLAVLCDLRIAASTARFAHPERTFGDVVYAPLHDLVGGAVARELTLGGRELSAAEALEVHLVTQVVAPDHLARAVGALVERVCMAPGGVLRRTKAKALRTAGWDPSRPTLEL